VGPGQRGDIGDEGTIHPTVESRWLWFAVYIVSCVAPPAAGPVGVASCKEMRHVRARMPSNTCGLNSSILPGCPAKEANDGEESGKSRRPGIKRV
jgi:hypothetical protein